MKTYFDVIRTDPHTMATFMHESIDCSWCVYCGADECEKNHTTETCVEGMTKGLQQPVPFDQQFDDVDRFWARMWQAEGLKYMCIQPDGNIYASNFEPILTEEGYYQCGRCGTPDNPVKDSIYERQHRFPYMTEKDGVFLLEDIVNSKKPKSEEK